MISIYSSFQGAVWFHLSSAMISANRYSYIICTILDPWIPYFFLG
jgi:hypothetical protein